MDVKNVIKEKGFTLEKVANELGITRVTLSQNLSRNSTVKTLQKIAKVIGCNVGNFFDDEEIKEAWFAFLLDIPQKKLDLLLELKKSYKVFMLSNTNAIHFPEIKRKYFEKDGHNLSDYFDKCYLSYEIHQNKPAKEIFDFMIRDSAILPQESLFIDDGRTNIEMAKGLKFQTYLAKEQEDFSHLFVSLL